MAEKNKFNNLDDEDMFVTLDLDDGSSMECQILTIFEADGLRLYRTSSCR